MNFKVVHLSQEINHLQKLFREENDINESIRHEVTRLTSENMVQECVGLLQDDRSKLLGKVAGRRPGSRERIYLNLSI